MVISIITLLVSILLPSLNKAKELARRSVCRSQLHGVGVGMRMYLNDHRETMPVAAAMPSLGISSEPPIAKVLAPYLDNPEILQCPSDAIVNDPSFFSREGSSYAYQTMLGGTKVGQDFLTTRLGASSSPVMYDYEPFHGNAGEAGAMNYLFADLHVGDMK